MNDPLLNLERPKPYSEIVMVGLAAVGIGILLGIWVAAPALTGTASAVSDPTMRSIPMSYNDMMAQPDPFPYRTATPAFDSGGRIDYAAAAKARAQAEYGGRLATGDDATDPWDRQTRRTSPRSYVPDRHSGIH
jgi:hypothetical protein